MLKFDQKQRIAEIFNLITLSGFSQLAGIYTMFYAWNWTKDENPENLESEGKKVKAIPWKSGEPIFMDRPFNNISLLQNYFTMEEQKSKDSIIKLKN